MTIESCNPHNPQSPAKDPQPYIWERPDPQCNPGTVAYRVDGSKRYPYTSKQVENAYRAGYGAPDWWTSSKGSKRIRRSRKNAPGDNPVIYRAKPEISQSDQDGLERLIADSARAYVAAQESDPLLREGLELGAVIMPCEPRQPDTAVLVDPELARLPIALKQFNVYRVWLYAHKLHDGCGWIERNALEQGLKRQGVIHSGRTFDHILAHGAGYWRIAPGTDPQGNDHSRVYLTSAEKLAARLTKKARRVEPLLVETNRPGMQKVWLDLTGDLQAAEATVYAAWLNLKDKGEGVRIERAKLQTLWRRSKNILLKWERLAGIKTSANFAEFDTDNAPPDAYLCLDKDGTEYASKRLANTYVAPSVKEHSARSNRRKIRAAANAKVSDQIQPANVLAGGSVGHSIRTGKIYFQNKRTQKGFVPAEKAIDSHLRQHGDVLDRRHYAKSVQRYGVQVWGYSTGKGRTTRPRERDFQAEADRDFTDRRTQFRIGWQGRI